MGENKITQYCLKSTELYFEDTAIRDPRDQGFTYI